MQKNAYNINAFIGQKAVNPAKNGK